MELTQLVKQVREAAKKAAEQSRQVNLGDLWERLLDIDTEVAIGRIESLRPHGWPGAVPVWEPITTAHATQSDPVQVIAVDGSQIYPAADHPVRWAYVHALPYPWLEKRPVTGQFIDIREIERFRVIDEDWKSWNSNAYVDALRTLLELQVAKEVAGDKAESVILLDNPLLPCWWLHPDLLESYTETVARMQGAKLAGYVSCPHSHLLYNLIRLVDEDLDFPKAHAIADDAQLMAYGLSIGQRSAIFLHGSRRNVELEKAGAGVFFFFLKLSDSEVARVEVPEWVARSPGMLDQIQASILFDSQLHHYPESLLLAHQSVAIPLKTGWQLNKLAMQVFVEHNGRYYMSAKLRSKERKSAWS